MKWPSPLPLALALVMAFASGSPAEGKAEEEALRKAMANQLAKADALMRAHTKLEQEQARLKFQTATEEWEVHRELRRATVAKDRIFVKLMRENPKESERQQLIAFKYKNEQDEAEYFVADRKARVNNSQSREKVTPEMVAEAERKLEETRQKVMEGEGELLDAMRNYYAALNSMRDKTKPLEQKREAMQEKVSEHWRLMRKQLPAEVLDRYTEKHMEWQETVDEAVHAAKSAWGGKADPEESYYEQWEEEKKWPAAKKRFDDLVEGEVDVSKWR